MKTLTPAAKAFKAYKADTAQTVKVRIQALIREIAILRDGGCILRNCPQAGPCNGYTKNDNLILQYDHLVTRGKSVSFADTRLGVCLCLGHHGGFKKWHKEQYDKIVKKIISPKRVALWERTEEDNRTYPMGKSEWLKVEIGLRSELQTLQK